ncbi:uncharacterized protein G2W53_039858 [Senna tora]|uniref:Uncharacterized protein n=1 Tax=Senna tora TaxID=362788 RepID=A0A834W345_9FABA|nr:uncharacterized protein G2W53_039858 [Senna tora]
MGSSLAVFAVLSKQEFLDPSLPPSPQQVAQRTKGIDEQPSIPQDFPLYLPLCLMMLGKMEFAVDRVNLSKGKAKKRFLPHSLPAICCSEQRIIEKDSRDPSPWRDNMESPQRVTE